MKIIFSNYDDIKNPFYGGGGAYAIHEIAKRFAEKGDNVIVITGDYKNSKQGFMDNVKYKRIGLNWVGPKIGQLVYHLILPYYLKKSEFDIWIESFTPPHSTSFLPLISKKPVVGLAHMLASEDMRRKYKLPFHLIEKLGLRFYKYFIVLNRDTVEKVRKVNKSAVIDVIPNGINFPSSIYKRRSEHLLFIGRIEMNQKGLDLLLKAYKKINDAGSLKLVIAGGGTEIEVRNLKNLISKLDLEDKVKYVGRVTGKKKDNLFRKACLVVIPSRYETFSLVSLEAASWGLPIVCFDIKGLKWLPKSCAAKLDCFDIEKFYEKIQEVMFDSSLQKTLGERAQKHVRLYSWDNIFRKYQKFINQIA